jgi:predicted dehydrogenase
MGEQPVSVNCRGSAHITPGIEDVTTMCLTFSKQRSAIIHSSWLDPRKVREMTIVGSKRMIVYDDVAPLEKVRIFDARVERAPHYDTFAEFQYAYHYGDMYVPYIKQEEPLKTECQHFLDCIRDGKTPLTDGQQGLDLVRILEASSESLKRGGAPIKFSRQQNGNGWRPPFSRMTDGALSVRIPETRLKEKKRSQKIVRPAAKIPIKIQLVNGQ